MTIITYRNNLTIAFPIFALHKTTMKTLLFNISGLLQVDRSNHSVLKGETFNELPQIRNAYLLIKDGLIEDFGSMDQIVLEDVLNNSDHSIDCTGRFIFPGYCDSHTHIVFAKNRSLEFVDRINGLSYQEIAERGGGILNSAKAVEEAGFEELYQASSKRLDELISLGTTAIEIKSGYGLSKEAEIKMLRVIQALKQEFNIPIKSTFLGAHALPASFKDDKKAYLDLMLDEVLPIIEKEKLADYIDIFCEKGYFEIEDLNRVMDAGKSMGLPSKVHINQFNSFGGLQVAIEKQALTVDHLEVIKPEDLLSLQKGQTIAVGLPLCSYFLSIDYAPVKKMAESGIAIALASDYNPGSTPSGNMNQVLAAACIKMKLTPEQAINAVTFNGAAAIELQDEIGSIDKGKRADFIITKQIDSYYELPYSFGSNLIHQVWVQGKEYKRKFND